jgi:hypothetical protein
MLWNIGWASSLPKPRKVNLNLKQSSHYKEGPPQYMKVHQIFLYGGPVVHQGKKVSVKP